MIEIKNFISDEECNLLIDIHQQNDKNIEPNYQRPFYINGQFPNIENKVLDICKNLCPLAQLEVVAIVHWHDGSFMNPHYDHYHDLFAGIIYLNDDYIGGETCFSFREVKPEKGKLLLFSSCGVRHWVNKICGGERYTLAFWITKSDKMIYVPGINTR